MRILHIIQTLSPEAGGPSQAVRMLLSYRDLGYFGEVVTLDDPAESFLKTLDFPVHAFGPTTDYGHTPRLIPWIKEHHTNYDGVIVHGLWRFCGSATRQALAGTRTPYMVFPHGMLDPYFKRAYPLKHLKKWLYWIPVEYHVLRNAYRVLFTSQAEKQLAEETFWLHRWTPHVVPYGVSGPPQGKSKDLLCEAFFEHCPRVRGRRFLLFLGRIHRKKGCDLLLEAFGRAAQKDPALHLVVAGPDQQGWNTELQQIARGAGVEDRVHWPGMLTGDAKWGAFYAAEAFILPSHQENFGIAVAEALACGTPVLLADKVNIAEDVANDGAGLMEPDTLEGTMNLLHRWIAMPSEEKAAMSERAKICYEAHYDMQENAKTIIRIFESSGATNTSQDSAR